MDFAYLRHLMHCQPTVVEAVVADTQTITVGNLVAIAAGLVTKVSDSVHTLVLGIALEAITTTTHAATDKIKVLLIDEFSVLRVAYTGTAASLVEADVWTSNYDVEGTTTVTLHLDDETNGFLRPVTLLDAAVDGYVDVVVVQAALWNAALV
jgi:hypothetical protein